MKQRVCQGSEQNIVSFDQKRYVVDEETGELLEILSDKTRTGRERPWREHKIENQSVEQCYRRLADDSADRGVSEYWTRRADRLHDCGAFLQFNVYDAEGGREMKIKHANSCRVRLCPLCTWRRSIKIQTHTRAILEHMQAEKKYEYILVTLTVPSVTGAELSDKITDMMTAWNRFAGYKAFKQAVKGWYRGLEVTHNLSKYKFRWVKKGGKRRKEYLTDDAGNKIPNPAYDTYHPHFHCIMAVDDHYFRGRDYIKHEDWLAMWRKATRDESITQVDVRRVKPKKVDNVGASFGDMMIQAVCEVAKYTVKASDYVMPWDWDMSCKSVSILDGALADRRLVAYGGVMKDWHKKLNLDDEIDGDLIEDGETPNGEVVGEVCAVWNVGYQQYIIATDK